MNTKSLLLTLAFIQFNHIVDFMMIMPLSTHLMTALEINTQQFSLVVAAYSLSAGVSGLFVSSFIDRFDRKKTLVVSLFFFSLATFFCGATTQFWTLLVFRSLAGVFGGILGSQILSIIGDSFPIEKRGSAMGFVMTAFSIASVVGVPGGLWIANQYQWNTPFFVLGLLSVISFVLALFFIPPVKGHLQNEKRSMLFTFRAIFQNKNQRLALLTTFSLVIGQFTVIPFIAPFLVNNVLIPESQIFLVYLIGGCFTFFTARIIGKLSDKYGRKRVLHTLGYLSILPLLIFTNLPVLPIWGVLPVTVLFMVFISGRMIPAMSLITATVPANLRGGFMSINTTVQMSAAGIASFIGGLIITEEKGQLKHYPFVGIIAVIASLVMIYLSNKLIELKSN